ncbi:LysR family transcriptional regulator [Thalassotalea euphylliae]|uniref:LysR family transcriptional regulator n=1 Tax=Thalassotalea euphylliae TaxID=1655234 RepID=UPI0036413CB2
MKGATYNQLATFHCIVSEGSISGAARQLEIAPASVSQSLKLLESHLGLPLFTRTTRRIELTEAGHQLFAQTQSAMFDIDSALENVGDLSQVPSGHVRITTPRFAYQFFLAPIYAEFCQRYPEITLEISISDKAEDIIKEGFDVGIRFGDRIAEGMVARQLTPAMRDAMFVSQGYAEKHCLPETPNDLHNHKMVQYRFIASNQIAPLRLNNDGEELLVDMESALISNDTDVMVDAAAKGLGIGRLIEPMVKHQLTSGKLIPVLEDYWFTYPGLYVYFVQHAQRAKRVRVLIDFLQEKAMKQWS